MGQEGGWIETGPLNCVYVSCMKWAVVVMRPDGSRGVLADLAAGAKLPALLWVAIVVLLLGILILGGGAALIYFVGGRETRAPGTPAA